ncbi:MAG: hypothetical protein NDJ89_08630 [Oligoflexia bacterium]|nr:hypothetical protein [Oligoflexia bacterium]
MKRSFKGLIFGFAILATTPALALECGLEGTEQERIADCAAKLGDKAVLSMVDVGFSRRVVRNDGAQAFYDEGFRLHRSTIVTWKDAPITVKRETLEPVVGEESEEEMLGRINDPGAERVCIYRQNNRHKALRDCAHATAFRKEGYDVKSWSVRARTARGTKLWRNEQTGRVWSALVPSVGNVFSARRFCAKPGRGAEFKGGLDLPFALPACEELSAELAGGLRFFIPVEDAENDQFWCQLGNTEKLMAVKARGGLTEVDFFDGAGVLCAAKEAQ